MEMTASMMLNSAGNDFVQSSRMSSFPSSESISSVMSWHGHAESLKTRPEIATEAVDQRPKVETCIDKVALQQITVDLLPERFGFLKKHVKYLIKGPVCDCTINARISKLGGDIRIFCGFMSIYSRNILID